MSFSEYPNLIAELSHVPVPTVCKSRDTALLSRAVNPHSFFAEPDIHTVAVFLSADPDPDPAAFLMRIQIQFKNICKKI